MGTHELVVPVKAIGSWLQKRHSAKLSIVMPEKKIMAENLTGKDAAHLLHLFLTPKYRTQGARSL